LDWTILTFIQKITAADFQLNSIEVPYASYLLAFYCFFQVHKSRSVHTRTQWHGKMLHNALK